MKPLSVYVHIPFCTVKCGYCDFNAYAGMDAFKAEYGLALAAEVRAGRELFEVRSIRSVGFGGGTPGEVPATDIAAVMRALRESAPFEADAEVTLEVNPGTSTSEQYVELRRAGVTRLSIGAQSFDAGELRFLDRIHSPEANAAAVEMARKAGFEHISVDLIYGLPGQSMDGWLGSVERALESDPGHASLYALTVEEGTPLARRVERGEVTMPGDDEVAALYEAASERLERGGYRQYELSNWARPGHESRHNQVYWTDGDYVAIGAGAHGYFEGERYENIARPREYARAVREGAGPRPAMASSYLPDRATSMSDWLTLRLRLLRGFERGEFAERFGVDVEEVVGSVLRECAEAGVLVDGPFVRLTKSGRLLHGEVAARLTAGIREALGEG